MSKRTRIQQAPPPQERLNDIGRKAFCITKTNVTDEKILMLAVANIGDNLHDFAGSRSELDDKKISAITDDYITFLIKAKNEEAIQPKRQHYLDLINAIKNSTAIDKDLKIIYAKYFNNNETEPELEWASLEQLTTIKDNFEVIIGNKKALLNLTTPAGNNFLNTLRPIIQRNTHFERKKINFVIDVSTIGNNIFTDEDSKICKGTANYFDDFHRPLERDDFRYISKEINFNVNILDTISNQERCKLNHLALTDFRIEDGKIKWNNNKIIDIDSTTPSEFGVSKYSTLILESGKKKQTKAELLRRFKDITGLDNSLLKSTEYGKYIFDFKRLMDSSQIMYTYHLNKQQEDTKYIFVTHDNMAAVIARIIGVPYIHTHINGSIRSISVHLATEEGNIIEKEVIKHINDGIFLNIKHACDIVRPPIHVVENTSQNIIKNVTTLQLNDFIKARNAGVDYNNLRINIILRWIISRYVNFLNNAKMNLEKYIHTIKNNPNLSYEEFKILKDTDAVLNINYTATTLDSDYTYILTLIENFNRFKDIPGNGSLSKQFYEIIKNDSGYLFSTLDFKMLIYCLMTDGEKAAIQPDFDTTYYTGIHLKTDGTSVNGETSHKIILKRFFKKIVELYPPVVVAPLVPIPRLPPSKKPRWHGGGMEAEDEYVELVEAFIESIKDKNDLKAYSEVINSRGAPTLVPVPINTYIRPTPVQVEIKTSYTPNPRSAAQTHLTPRSRTRKVASASASARTRWYGGDSGSSETERYQFYEDFLNKLHV